MKKRKDVSMNVLVLFGGCSSEYGVSLESAGGVLRHMDKNRFTPVPVGITREGAWYLVPAPAERIACDAWQENSVPAMLSPNRGERALLVFRTGEIQRIPIDAVFPVLHGRNGEDGTVQGLCELAGIPLVGCGTLASALCMDKDRARKLAAAAGVRVPRSFVAERGTDPQQMVSRGEEIGYPLFVKPVKAGSSYGVTKVWKPEDLPKAVAAAFAYDNQVILEETIPGFETGCAVMGNTSLITGEMDEIELTQGFFDFREKYNLITSKIHVPARIPKEKSDQLKHTAKMIYRALGCRVFARVDLFLTPEGEIVFNEVNTIPGFTAHSRFPSMMRAAGISFEEVLTKAIHLAVEP